MPKKSMAASATSRVSGTNGDYGTSEIKNVFFNCHRKKALNTAAFPIIFIDIGP